MTVQTEKSENVTVQLVQSLDPINDSFQQAASCTDCATSVNKNTCMFKLSICEDILNLILTSKSNSCNEVHFFRFQDRDLIWSLAVTKGASTRVIFS